MGIAGSLTVLSRLVTHFIAVMIRLSGNAAFSLRVCVVIWRPDGDSDGSVWATSMRITSPLLNPQASVDTTGGESQDAFVLHGHTYRSGRRKLSTVPRRIELPTGHQLLRSKPIPVILLFQQSQCIFEKLRLDNSHDGQH
jgi:hypothetical protein